MPGSVFLYDPDTNLKIGASGSPLIVSSAGLEVAQGSTTLGESGPLMQGAVTTSNPAYTTGQTSPLSLTTTGLLRIQPVNSSNLSIAAGAGTGNNALRVSPASDANFGVSPYPWSSTAGTTATPITATSGNVANASAVATLAGVSAKTTYITGFIITAAGATTGLAVNVTLAGVITGTMTFTFVAPAGVLVAAVPLVVTFDTPIPASAVNTAIVLTLPALGAGNTNASANAFGYQL